MILNRRNLTRKGYSPWSFSEPRSGFRVFLIFTTRFFNLYDKRTDKNHHNDHDDIIFQSRYVVLLLLDRAPPLAPLPMQKLLWFVRTLSWCENVCDSRVLQRLEGTIAEHENRFARLFAESELVGLQSIARELCILVGRLICSTANERRPAILRSTGIIGQP